MSSATSIPSTPPLKGLRVVDFSAMIAGPYCTRWLADLGAEVIKIEPPEGDHMRHRAPLRDGHSAYFGHLNSGKRCIVLDLKQAAAVELARSLAAEADIVVEAFRPGVMARLGLGAAQLRARNPRLVHCAISGFGQDSDLAHRPAYAPIVHAASGLDFALGEDAEGRPQGANVPLADILTAMFACMSIQTALLQRERTGQGTCIDVNLMDSVMNVLPYELQAAQAGAAQPRPSYKPLRASDGWVLVTPINARNFVRLCEALGHPEWVDDPLLATDAARFRNWVEYMRRIESWTMQRTAAECEAVLSDQGVPCSRYLRVEEAMQEPQFEQRKSFATITDGTHDYLTARLPFGFDGIRPQPGARVAALGADTDAVLRERLSLTDADIDALAQARAIVCTPQPSRRQP
ncbi:CaiB/BaiF CoA-transferase family protein [Variovorax sp. KK3]|uniref:CaiB/BaiF CoA transferase family protein n=1 Tax=Variovorax sp. KK3 TaxID=1855728 RepID=UPI00097BBA27|nr:CoA transferase [Variovorax sp. KK3]